LDSDFGVCFESVFGKRFPVPDFCRAVDSLGILFDIGSLALEMGQNANEEMVVTINSCMENFFIPNVPLMRR